MGHSRAVVVVMSLAAGVAGNWLADGLNPLCGPQGCSSQVMPFVVGQFWPAFLRLPETIKGPLDQAHLPDYIALGVAFVLVMWLIGVADSLRTAFEDARYGRYDWDDEDDEDDEDE